MYMHSILMMGVASMGTQTSGEGNLIRSTSIIVQFAVLEGGHIHIRLSLNCHDVFVSGAQSSALLQYNIATALKQASVICGRSCMQIFANYRLEMPILCRPQTSSLRMAK